MARTNKRNKKVQKEIAKRRIGKLFLLAEESALKGKINLANRYVEIARKIKMKYLVPMPIEYKRRYCKHCYSYLLPDVSCRIRISKGKVVIYCNKCKKLTRIPFKAIGKNIHQA